MIYIVPPARIGSGPLAMFLMEKRYKPYLSGSGRFEGFVHEQLSSWPSSCALTGPNEPVVDAECA